MITGKELIKKCKETCEQHGGCPNVSEAGICAYSYPCREYKYCLNQADPCDIEKMMDEEFWEG